MQDLAVAMIMFLFHHDVIAYITLIRILYID